MSDDESEKNFRDIPFDLTVNYISNIGKSLPRASVTTSSSPCNS